LVKSEGNNFAWPDLAKTKTKIGDVLHAQGDLTAALKELEFALDIASSLARANPSNPDLQLDPTIHARIEQITTERGST
jgi:hypothetical protein